LGHIDVKEPEGYEASIAAEMPAFSRFGGRYLVRDGAFEQVEGSVRSVTVLIAFPSYAAALACHGSPEYKAATALRTGKADIDLIACEGYDGPQP